MPLSAQEYIDQRRRGAERDHVGKRVVLLAEGALRVGHARHAAVEAVEQHRDEDGDRCGGELVVHRHHDGVEAGEQVAGGEGVGKQVDAARPARAPAGNPARGGTAPRCPPGAVDASRRSKALRLRRRRNRRRRGAGATGSHRIRAAAARRRSAASLGPRSGRVATAAGSLSEITTVRSSESSVGLGHRPVRCRRKVAGATTWWQSICPLGQRVCLRAGSGHRAGRPH